MFLGLWLLVAIVVAFFVGIPISFGIGYFIGRTVCKILKAERGRNAIMILSGTTYIISQPISYVVLWNLLRSDLDLGILEKYLIAPIVFLVLFAIVFTTIISIIVAKIANSQLFVKKKSENLNCNELIEHK